MSDAKLHSKNKKKRIAGNGMYRLVRNFSLEQRPEKDLADMNVAEFLDYLDSLDRVPLPDFDKYIDDKIACWTKLLTQDDFPDPFDTVRCVAQDGVLAWAEVSEREVQDDLYGKDASGSIMLGFDYIDLVVEELTQHWWLNRLCKAAYNLLACEDPNAKLYLSMEVKKCERDFENQMNNLRAVETGRKTTEDRKHGGRMNRRPDHDKIIQAMDKYIEADKSISSAARIAFEKDKLGKNANANRSLYYYARKEATEKKTVGI